MEERYFSKDDACQIFIDSVNKARIIYKFKVIAYVIMPDHVHLLMLPAEDNYQISKILTAIKLPVSMKVSKLYQENTGLLLGKFWQRGGGYDRNIVSKEAIFASINYIHHNPVRKGLCVRPEDWKWSSASLYAKQGESQLKINNEVLAGLF